MTKIFYPFIVLSLLYNGGLFAQADSLQVDSTDYSLAYADEISSIDLERYMMILSSDEYEGRETTSKGALKASQYIAAQFENFGLPEYKSGKGYFQEVPFQRNAWKKINLSINGEEYKHLVDYVALLPYNHNRSQANFNEIIYLGYGIADKKYNDYAAADVKGKAILISKGEPQKPDGTYVVSDSEAPSPWGDNIDLKLKAAKAAGVALVLIIEDQVKEIVAENRQFLIDGKLRLHDGTIRSKQKSSNSVFISPGMAQNLMGDQYEKVIEARDKIISKGKTKGKALPIEVNLRVEQKKYADVLKSNNVIGILEGSDPQLKDEYILLSAHYDHLGIRGDKVFNGANDNASGTATIVQLMKAFSKAKKEGKGPKRSIIALLVCGEEKGLLGSKYYTKLPAFPLGQTVVNVNVDMIGRTDRLHGSSDEYIYVIGADKMSSELHEINEAVNGRYVNLELDYRFNDESDPNRYYYRSDHYNFVKAGIPAIFYFNGVHDDYHKSSDTIDKMNFKLMEKTAKLIFHTTWELANRPERIAIDKVEKQPKE